MTIVTIEDAQANLKELIHQLSPGEELLITDNQQTVAKLVSHVSAEAVVTKPALTSWPCEPGTAKDTKHWMAPDFDAPLDDFSEYME